MSDTPDYYDPKLARQSDPATSDQPVRYIKFAKGSTVYGRLPKRTKSPSAATNEPQSDATSRDFRATSNKFVASKGLGGFERGRDITNLTALSARGTQPHKRATAMRARVMDQHEADASRLGSIKRRQIVFTDDEVDPITRRVPPRTKSLAIKDQLNRPLIPRSSKGWGPFYFDSIEERSLFYLGVQERYGFQRDSRWFEAAYRVTSRSGVGAADMFNLNKIHDPTEAFLRIGNEVLSVSNVEVFANAFASGSEVPGAEGLRGRALDHRMVEIEQRNLQKFMDKYFATISQADRQIILEDINSGFQIESSEPRHRAAMNYAMKAFMDHDFDFARIEDRVLLGKRITDYLRDAR